MPSSVAVGALAALWRQWCRSRRRPACSIVVDVAEHHRDAVCAATRRSRRGGLDVLPLSGQRALASEGRAPSSSRTGNHRSAEAGPRFVHTGPNAIAHPVVLRSAFGRRSSTVDRCPACSRPSARSAPLRLSRSRRRARGELTAALDRVKSSVAGARRGKCSIIVGRRTGTLTDMIAVGPGSYLHDLPRWLAGSTSWPR